MAVITQDHVEARAVNAVREALAEALDTLLQAGVPEDEAERTMEHVVTMAIEGDWRLRVTPTDVAASHF